LNLKSRRRALLASAVVVLLLAGCTAAPPATRAPLATIAPLPPLAMASTVGVLPPVATSTSSAPPTMASAIMKDARRWAFRVRSVACLATGSSFEVRGGIVTNRHVASGSTAVEMSTWDGTDFDAGVSGISSGPDLALLSNDDVPVKSAAGLAAADPRAGTAVWVAGYPEGDQLTVTDGRVIDYISGSLIGITNRVMEITNSVEPGNSGSALVDGAGAVVGVVFAIRLSNHRGLAIPVSELTAFLASPGSQLISACAA